MNKWLMRLGSLLMIIGLLVGCGSNTNDQDITNNNQTEQNQNNDNNTSEIAEEVIVVTISKNENEEVITEKEIAIEEGAILLDVMKENFDIEEDDGFITSIDGVEQDIEAQMSWMYFVNEEMVPVGAGEYELSVGDKVNFDLQSWE